MPETIDSGMTVEGLIELLDGNGLCITDYDLMAKTLEPYDILLVDTLHTSRFQYPEDAEGCWYDGARGIYIGEAVQQEAIDRGWIGWREDREVVGCGGIDSQYEEGENPEDYHEATQGAEEYLNQFAPEGYWIGYSDGDFGMYRTEDNEDSDCTVCGKTWPRMKMNFDTGDAVCPDCTAEEEEEEE